MPGYQQRQGYNGMPQMGYRGGPRNMAVREEPDPDSEQFRKLFIGGLSFNTDEASLKKYFDHWGEITDCIVMKEKESSRSRGFGFITFKEKESVDEVQRDRPHKVDSRDVETKRAMPKDCPNSNQQTVNKMFLGGLKDDTTEEMVRSVCSEYGTIKDVEMISDKATGKIKGFCFVTFDDYDPVDKLVLQRRIPVNSKKVEVKKAFAKAEMDKMVNMTHMMHGMNLGQGPMQMSMGGRGDYAGGYSRDFDRCFYNYPNGQGMNNYNGRGGNWHGHPMYNDNFYNRGYNYGGNHHGGSFNNNRR